MSSMQFRSGNEVRLRQMRAAQEELLKEILRRGFYGKGTIELVVQDGVIQQIRREVEQVVQD